MVATTFINTSFEIGGGNAGTVSSVGTENFVLADLQDLDVIVNRETPQKILFEIGTQSTILSANAETYNITASQTVEVSVDGAAFQTATFLAGTGSLIVSAIAQNYALVVGFTLFVQVDSGTPQVVTFVAADFSDISAATAAEVAAVISTQVTGATGSVSGTSVQIDSDLVGFDALINVTGGTAAFLFNFPVGVAGFGAANLAATTAQEAAGVLVDAIAGAFALDESGSVRLGSLTKGAASLIDVTGGTAAAAFAFPAGGAGVSNFVDITAATAAEVKAVLDAQLTDATTATAGGGLQLTTARTGIEACIQVTGGSANAAFAFPTTEVCGLTNPGFAQGWTVVLLSSGWEFGEFAVGEDFPSATEDFTIGWAAGLDVLGTTVPGTFNLGVDLFEDFTWFGFVGDLTQLGQGTFNTGGTSEGVEPFDQGWPSFPGAIDDTDVLGTVAAGVFTPGPDETFDSNWLGNENDVTVLGPTTAIVFGGSGAAETFASSTTIHTEIEVLLAVAADIYDIALDGVSHVYVAQGGDSEGDIAIGLQDAVNNGPLQISAVRVLDRVQITQDEPGDDLVVQLKGSQSANMTKTTAFAVDPSQDWTGEFFNPKIP